MNRYASSVGSEAASLVSTMIAESGESLRALASSAGVSVSTVQRAKDPATADSLGLAVLWRILAAGGSSFELAPKPLYDPAAIAAYASLEGADAELDERAHWWLCRLSKSADPAATAARAAAPQHSPGAVLATGVRAPVTWGRLASAGDASGSRWALSGTIAIPESLQAPVDPIGVLWVDVEPSQVMQLLADTVRPVKILSAAECVVARGTAELFEHAESRPPLMWAGEFQRRIDVMAVGAGIGRP